MNHKNIKWTQKKAFFTILIMFVLSIESYAIEQTQQKIQTQDNKQIKIDEVQTINKRQSNVFEINELNFNQFLNKNDNILIYFYTQDCQFCYEFTHTFSQLQNNYQSIQLDKHKKIEFGKLQLTNKTQTIFRNLNIDAVPQLKYFNKGKAVQYPYLFNQYNLESIENHMIWINRISQVGEFDQKVSQTHRLSIFGNSKSLKQSFYIPQIQSIEELSKQLMKKQNSMSKQVKISNSNVKIFIMNCTYEQKQSENKQLSVFLKSIYLQHLNYNFYCTQNHSILFTQNNIKRSQNNNQIFLNVYQFNKQHNNIVFNYKLNLDKRIELNTNDKQQNKQIKSNQINQQDFINFKQIYSLNFKNYLNRQIQYWNDNSAIQVFTKNNSAFIFIMNNETKSKSIFQDYKKIKSKLNDNNNIPNIKFYFTDLSQTPQQTTRIKKYISGIQTSIKKTYPYPILSYIKPQSDYVKKYLFPMNNELTSQNMQKWILDIFSEVQNVKIQKLNHNQNKKQVNDDLSLQQNKQDLSVSQYFRTTPQQLFPPRYIDSFYYIYENNKYTQEQQKQKLKIPSKILDNYRQFQSINFNDFKVLLSTLYQQSFFVFINCRNDMKSFQLYTDITQWWEESDDQQTEQQGQVKQITKSQQNIKKSQNKSPQNNNNVQTIVQPHPQKHQNERQLAQIQNKQTIEDKKLENQHQKLKNQHEQHKNQEQRDAQKTLNQKQIEQSKQQVQNYDQKQLFKLTSSYLMNFNNNDYPPYFKDVDGNVHQLKIQYFPSYLYFSKDKKIMKKLQGVQNIAQIKQFMINQVLKNNKITKQQQNNKIQQKVIVKDLQQSDRELQGQVILNTEKEQN